MNDFELHQLNLNIGRQRNGPSQVNNKPYRTKAQKAEAAANCWKTKGGFYRSDAPVSFHNKLRQASAN
jgi:hypothetical protein